MSAHVRVTNKGIVTSHTPDGGGGSFSVDVPTFGPGGSPLGGGDFTVRYGAIYDTTDGHVAGPKPYAYTSTIGAGSPATEIADISQLITAPCTLKKLTLYVVRNNTTFSYVSHVRIFKGHAGGGTSFNTYSPTDFYVAVDYTAGSGPLLSEVSYEGSLSLVKNDFIFAMTVDSVGDGAAYCFPVLTFSPG
jgi:hypothetical protein